MPKITEYACVTGSDAEAMEVTVNEMIQDGWQPFGGVSVTRQEPETEQDFPHILAQAVVRYAE